MSAFYQPKEIDLFASVLDRACSQKPAAAVIDKEVIAARILHEAERGERDPERLLKIALGSVSSTRDAQISVSPARSMAG